MWRQSSTQSGAPQVLISFLTIFPERQTGQLLIGILVTLFLMLVVSKRPRQKKPCHTPPSMTGVNLELHLNFQLVPTFWALVGEDVMMILIYETISFCHDSSAFSL